ncbi:hypothetical protein J7J18_02580 [bacterium]|nr:hypothetical protein [bacterium]
MPKVAARLVRASAVGAVIGALLAATFYGVAAFVQGLGVQAFDPSAFAGLGFTTGFAASVATELSKDLEEGQNKP